MIEAALGGAAVPITGGALGAVTGLAAARVAAVHVPTIAWAAHEEESLAEPAADLP